MLTLREAMERPIRWGMVLGAGLLLGLGCGRASRTEAPRAAAGDPSCNPADDCNEIYGSTVRQHSDRAGTFAPLATGCPYAPGEVPPLEPRADAGVPELVRTRSRASNMHRGDERLQEIDLHEHMMGMQGQIFACVDLAACYKDGAKLTGKGELAFELELGPDGRVVAVSVQVSPGLDHPSVVACARRTMFDYRFPRYDGGQMMLEYTMTIDEVPDA